MKGKSLPFVSLLLPFRCLHVLLFLFLFIQACENEHSDFHRLNEEVEFRRVFLGGGEREVAPNEAVRFFVRMTTPEKDPRWIGEDTVTVVLSGPANNWSDMLCSMTKGDSSIFRIARKGLPPYPEGMKSLDPPDSLERVRLEIRLVDHIPSFSLLENALKRREGNVPAGLWREWKGIQQEVLKRSADPEKHFVNGIYLFLEEKGSGEKIKKGREVGIHYRGHLPDRTVFDDSYDRREPFSFRYGDPEQVIEGMERGLGRLREGDRASLVIPSNLAFEKKNLSEGILPPYTFVIYYVEVMEVEDP